MEIGAKELYDAIQDLGKKLDAHMQEQGPKFAVLDQRVTQLEKQGDRRWQLYVALIGAAVSIALAVVNLAMGA